MRSGPLARSLPPPLFLNYVASAAKGMHHTQLSTAAVGRARGGGRGVVLFIFPPSGATFHGTFVFRAAMRTAARVRRVQMIRMGAGRSLTFQRVSRGPGLACGWRERVGRACARLPIIVVIWR
eukprot:gene16366-biopygen20273